MGRELSPCGVVLPPHLACVRQHSTGLLRQAVSCCLLSVVACKLRNARANGSLQTPRKSVCMMKTFSAWPDLKVLMTMPGMKLGPHVCADMVVRWIREEIGAQQVSTVVSDNAFGMDFARDLAVKEPRFSHMLPLRCLPKHLVPGSHGQEQNPLARPDLSAQFLTRQQHWK